MQRITRLVSGPPSRGRWTTRAGLAVLVAAGAVLAVQAGVSGSRAGLHIRSSTDGVMGPGDSREITARGIDGERRYRATVDAQGRLTEVYRRDGQVQPIDGGVRRWLAEVERLSVPPPPPAPPEPPLPPEPPRPSGSVAGSAPPVPAPPPAPPAPPEPPELTESVEFRSLLRVVAANPDVIARLGAPIAMASTRVRGRIDVDNGSAPDGDADLSFDLTGPKRRATVHVEAQLEEGVWSVDTLEFASAVR